MLNHIHLIVKSEDMIGFVRDFKTFTSKELNKNIIETEPNISSSLDIFVFSKYLLNLFFDISCFGSKMIKMFPGESFCGFSNPFQAFHGEQINTFSRRLVSNVFSPDSTRGYSRLCLEDKNY